MAHHYTVKLAGKRYAMEELPIAANREFRHKIEPIFEQHGQRIFELFAAEVGDEGGELDWAALAAEFGPLALRALGSIDAMIDLAFDAGPPEMQKDRKRIEDEATLTDIYKVFLKAVALNYPLRHWGEATLDFVADMMPGANGRVPDSESEEAAATVVTELPLSEASTESGPTKPDSATPTSESS